MRILIADDYQEMSNQAANIMSAVVVLKPNAVLGLATGTTPLGLYKQLIERNKENKVDFSQVRTANLDEYVGLPKEDVQSYDYFMHDNLFDHINIAKENCHLPNGMAEDMETECKRYDDLIAAMGGVDLQLLGIGANGHIGFNEPADYFVKSTNVVKLTQSTIEANSRLFEKIEDVPVSAVSMGVKTIMQAKKILMIVNGAGKAEIVKQAFFGPITPQVPASILQLHNDITIVLDSEAAALIK